MDGGLGSVPKGTSVSIGIDPSLTGYALTAIEVGGDRFESWLYKSNNRGIERLMDISMWTSMKIQELEARGLDILDVAIEDTVVVSPSAVLLGELSAIVRTALLHGVKGQGRYPLKVPPTMVKKFATDRGNAKKNEVMLAIYKKYSVEFADDNLADSYVIARIAAGCGETAYESLILQKLSDPKFRDLPRV